MNEKNNEPTYELDLDLLIKFQNREVLLADRRGIIKKPYRLVAFFSQIYVTAIGLVTLAACSKHGSRNDRGDRSTVAEDRTRDDAHDPLPAAAIYKRPTTCSESAP